MKLQILLLSSLLLLSMVTVQSCDDGKKDKESTANVTENEDFINCKSLLIIAEDRSGSTTGQRKLEADDYSKIIDAFREKSSGQVAVRVIGNPAPNQREFFLLSLDKQKELKELPEDAKMSVITKARNDNKKIAEKNLKISEKNKVRSEKFVSNVITNNVVNYKPHNNKDVTNIEDALHHIETKINEPIDYDNIWVLIISDGVHDATKLKTPLAFNPEESISLFLVGWQDKTVFNNIADKESFESTSGFIEYFKTLTCN